MKEKFILLTGCSGGGKTTLLDALDKRGFATVPEPGRRIVAEELTGDGRALPWVDLKRFAMRAVEMARSDLSGAHEANGPVFFDRGLIDAAVALEFTGGPSKEETLGGIAPYADPVFVVPPWEEKFETDAERQHDFQAAVDEYDRIRRALEDLGHETIVLPRVDVSQRVELVLEGCG